MTQATKEQPPDPHQELLAAFKVFDVDKSGSISPIELRQVLMSHGDVYTDEEIDEMIRQADLDGNGSIDCQFCPPPKLLCLYSPHHGVSLHVY
jgi:Ca2+-binding EF-hand superfamily protein